MSEQYLLSVQDLHTSFFTDSGEVHAVNGVSFNLDPGEVLGIITVCRKSPKKILGILSLSFAAAVHLICITANMISRL